jgi:hypothetical protein
MDLGTGNVIVSINKNSRISVKLLNGEFENQSEIEFEKTGKTFQSHTQPDLYLIANLERGRLIIRTDN